MGSRRAPNRHLPEICQRRCLLTQGAAPLDLASPWPLSCDVCEATRGAASGCAWDPRPLHTAEATGSKPVTPTSTNAFSGPRCAAGCQQIASKSQTVVAVALRASLRLGVLGTSTAAGENPAIAGVMWGSNPGSSSSSVPGQRHQGALTCGFSLPVVTAESPEFAVPCGPSADHLLFRFVWSRTLRRSGLRDYSDIVGSLPPGGPARQRRHSAPAHTACRCGRAMRWSRPKRGRRRRRHRRLQMSPTRRPSPPCRMAVLLAVAARSARDKKEHWLPKLYPEDRQAELASVLPKPSPLRLAVGSTR